MIVQCQPGIIFIGTNVTDQGTVSISIISPDDTTLVTDRATGVVSRINRRAANQQRMGESQATVIL